MATALNEITQRAADVLREYADERFGMQIKGDAELLASRLCMAGLLGPSRLHERALEACKRVGNCSSAFGAPGGPVRECYEVGREALALEKPKETVAADVTYWKDGKRSIHHLTEQQGLEVARLLHL